MKRKVIFLLFALVLLCSAASAESYVMAGFDGYSSTRSWEENLFFERMTERTGIHFTYQQYSELSHWNVAKAAILSGNTELPDVLFKAALTDEELLNGLDNGVLIDLATLLPEYAPNVWKVLQEHPDWLSAVTLPDGRIGALPTLNETNSQNAMWINTDWLEKVKLEMPTDFESLRTVLEAFRDMDPNGNGKKDEIPMTFLGPWELKFFSHAYGIAVNNYNLYQDEAGELHFWPMEDSFMELASVLRSFYWDGLLDLNGFTTADTIRIITDSKATLTYGSFFAPSPLNLVTAEMGKQFSIMMPLAYDGKQIYRDMQQDCITGSFAITTACSEPQKLLSWVDILYTEEGAIEAMVGKEGEFWSLDENDGTWSYSSEITTSDLNDLSVYDSGNLPWLFPKDFYLRFSDQEIARLYNSLAQLERFVTVPVERAIFRGEERQRLIAVQNELGKYVDESFARFILGEEEITEQSIAAFHQGLEEHGMDELLSLWKNNPNL